MRESYSQQALDGLLAGVRTRRVTQQVGERNMACVKAALGRPPGLPPVRRQAIAASGLRPLAFMEYDVEYVVRDIESLVFWLNALDAAHADVDGQPVLASSTVLNRVLAGNVDERGFVTNEHRYLAIAQAKGCSPPSLVKWIDVDRRSVRHLSVTAAN
jgi:hypothetical protein